MCKGKVDEMELRVLAENCPPLVQALMTYFGYTHRNLIRHAGKGKITTTKFIEAIMKGI